MQLQNTLYVTTPESYVHLDNNTVSLKIGDETKLRVPLHHLGAMVCFGHVSVSLPLMHRLAEEGIALVLLDANGRFKARLEGPTAGNVLLRHAQHRRVEDSTYVVNIARNFVAGKIKNGRHNLLRGARETRESADEAILGRAANDLAASLRSLPQANDLDTLRGIEGEAARQYFGALNFLIKPSLRSDFVMDGRTRRPPRDRVNALLSFIYSLLMNDCRSALESCGLDPQIGFLHALRPGRAALALDLMEEFRFFADRLALSLINRGQIKADGFVERDGGAVLLEGDSRKIVLVAYQERKQETLQHPLLKESIPMGLVPFVQARLIARTLRDDINEYLPYVVR